MLSLPRHRLLLSLLWLAHWCWQRGLVLHALLGSGFSSACTLPGSELKALHFACNHDTEEHSRT